MPALVVVILYLLTASLAVIGAATALITLFNEVIWLGLVILAGVLFLGLVSIKRRH